MKKRINHNNLLPWFTDDHSTLPAAYLRARRDFLIGLQVTSNKQQAPSAKLQAPSLTDGEG